MATLEQIIEEARALSPAEKGKLRQALDRELEQPVPLQSRAEETAWIDRHRDEYLGQWVAIEGDTLIAHGANPREVYLAAREAGVNSPFIECVEKLQDAFMGGWQ
jgi:hypothetical protein